MADFINTSPVFASLDGKIPSALFSSLKTPCYVIDEKQLEENARILGALAERTGCQILLAQKAFSNYNFYPLLAPYLAGTEASGLYEARLGREEMGDGEVHVFSAAYREDELHELLLYADHVIFNSVAQLERYAPTVKAHGKSVGLRINPECSTQEGHEIYDPCAEGSRLGVTRTVFDREMTPDLLALLDGVHFHTLCEQDADALQKTFAAVSEKFGDILTRVKWLNMGGGHHITKRGYDISLLEKVILEARARYGVTVYLEPGEAVALNAGYLAARVLDIVENGSTRIAILDASAACHMPDVIEMPYTPPLYGACEDGAYTYRLAGPTCLSGDVIGDYTLHAPLSVGDMLLFGDMAIYTTCKNNTFNGMPLPNIWRLSRERTLECLTDFGYADFKMRLGTRA